MSPVGGADAAAQTSRTGVQETPPTPELEAEKQAGDVSNKDYARTTGGGGEAAPEAAPLPELDLSGAAGAGVDHGPTEEVPGETGYLFGPTARPSESIKAGLMPSGRIKPPPNIGVTLHALNEAATDPSAPPALHALIALLNHHLSQG